MEREKRRRNITIEEVKREESWKKVWNRYRKDWK